MSDIKVQRGVTDIGNTGGTDSTFDEVSALTASFALNSCNQRTTSGDSGSGSDLEIDDLSGRLELTASDTLTFSRVSGSKNASMRFAWELIEYTGAGGGDNEFIVRSRNTVTLTGIESTTDTLDTTPTDTSNCIPFITGISSTVTTNGEDHATAITYIDDSGDLYVKRGGTTGTTIVQVVTVEFTGSNWEVYHAVSTGQAGDTGNITLNTDSDGAGGTTGDVTSWGSAFIHGSHVVTSGHEGLAHQAVIYNEGLTTDAGDTENINWEFDGEHAATGDHVAHVLRHPDMVVTRFSDTANAANASNVDITSAGLTDVSEATVVGYCTTSGTGDALARGWRNYRLTSTTNCEHWCHRSGNTMRHEIQIIDFSGITSVITPEISVFDNLNLSESIESYLNLGAISIDESLELTETLSPNIPIELLNNVDDIELSEAVLFLISLAGIDTQELISIEEIISLAESLGNINQVDQIELSEVINSILQVAGIDTSESININENISLIKAGDLLFEKFENVNVIETVNLLFDSLSLSKYDNITISELINTALTSAGINKVENIYVTEYLNALLEIGYISRSDNLTISETVTALIDTTGASVAENINISEFVSALFEDLSSIIIDQITVAEFLNIGIDVITGEAIINFNQKRPRVTFSLIRQPRVVFDPRRN